MPDKKQGVPVENDKLTKILEFLKLTSEGITEEDFKKAFKDVIDLLKQFKADVQQQMQAHSEMLSTTSEEAIAAQKQEMTDMESRLNSSVTDTKKTAQSEVRTITRLLGDEVQRLESLIPDTTNSEQSITELEAKTLSLTEEGSSTAIRTKLESLEGDERLDKSAIKGLEEEVETLKKQIASIPRQTGMRRVVYTRRVNLTSQVDGNTRSFTMPHGTLDILGIFGTQFPITFDTADWSFSGRTLTLATGITTPLSGQTLFALVETQFHE